MNEEKRVEKKEKKDNNTTVLTIIAIATLLIALVGATFAYFTAQANNSQNQSVSITTAAPVALQYETQGAISLPNARPGDHATSTFTVLNPTTATNGEPNITTYTYDLNLITITDTFVADVTGGANQLILTISGATTVGDTETAGPNVPQINSTSPSTINLTDGTQYPEGQSTPVVTAQRIAPGEKHTYTAELLFAETSTVQDSNASKTYAGHLDISNINQAS